ncbi:hypothetical protein OIU76_019830 [Salix suchowensis]|nr:hypothetical protein OIU76_019830 [Salix suchowensis]
MDENDHIILVSLSFCVLLQSLFTRLKPTNRYNLPPSPSAIPISSSLSWLLKSFSDLELILRSLRAKYGPVITLHIGSRPAIFITTHSLAHQALVQNSAVFADRPPPFPTSKVISSNQHNISSASYGPTWRLLRRNLTSEILHPSRSKAEVEYAADAKATAAEILIHGWGPPYNFTFPFGKIRLAPWDQGHFQIKPVLTSLPLKPHFLSPRNPPLFPHIRKRAAMAWLSRLAITAAPSLRRVSRFSGSQGYGSAAAVQFDYDYYDDCLSEAEEDYGQLNRINPNLESVPGSASGRGVQWVLIGDPGAKKHVYAEKLSKLLEVPHISMGTLLRQELNLNSSVYKQIAIAVNEGKLVPEDVIFGLLSKRLEEGYNRGENGFILDGIPRTRMQAEILDQIADIDLVVNFKCGEGNLVKRNFISAENSSYSVADAGSVSNEKFRIYAQEGKALEGYYRKTAEAS